MAGPAGRQFIKSQVADRRLAVQSLTAPLSPLQLCLLSLLLLTGNFMQSCARLKLSSLMDDAFDAPSISSVLPLSLSLSVGQFDLRLMQRKRASIGESPADCSSSSSPSQTVDLSWQPFNPTELSLGVAMLCFALPCWQYQTETDSSMAIKVTAAAGVSLIVTFIEVLYHLSMWD